VTVHGSSGADDLRVGSTNGFTRLNLNAGEAVGDADVEVDNPVYKVRVLGHTGDDLVDARGGAGTGAVLRNGPYGRFEFDDVAGEAQSADTVYAGDGPSTLWGRLGNDKLTAGSGPAELVGGGGADSLTGGPGDDAIEPTTGDDTVAGGAGNDLLDFYRAPSGVQVDLQATGPQATRAGRMTIEGIEAVTGSRYADVLKGSPAGETLFGAQGNDVLMGRGGDDVLQGDGRYSYTDTGVDTADFRDASGPVSVDLTKPAPQATGAAGSDTFDGIENAIGSEYADTLIGDEAANQLDGRGGPDVLRGGGGADMLAPGSTPRGAADGADEVDGGADRDTVSYQGRLYAVAVSLDGVRNDGADPNRDGVSSASEEGDLATDVEHVTGGTGPDRLTAFGNVANLLDGGPGDDWFDGGPGGDTLLGQAGNDTVSYAARTTRVAVSLGGLWYQDGADPNGDGVSTRDEEGDWANVENAIGGSGPDRLVAHGAGVNVLTGGPGADVLDAFDGTSAVDRLVCGTGTDSYRADPSDALDACETAAP
jgi:Ca2+-binding RTX toxin-like protein